MLICFIPAMGVSAASSELTLTTSNTQVSAGEEFTVTVGIKNSSGIYSVAFALPINDSAFEFVSASTTGSVCGQLGICGYDSSTKEYKFNGVASDIFAGLSGDGTLVKITLKAKKNAASGAYAISTAVDADNTINVSGRTVAVSDGTVSVRVGEDKPAGSITAAHVMLGKDISIKYIAKIDPLLAGAKMRFVVNGKDTEIAGVSTGNANEYEYVFKGIPPQCMGDVIRAELVLGDEVIAVKDGYSVLQYCKNMLASSPEKLGITKAKFDAMKTLIADLLEYGAKTQIYMDYKTDALVDEGIVGASTFEEFDDKSREVHPPVIEEVCFRAFGVHFDYTNSLFVKFTAPGMKKDELRINFSDTSYYLLSKCELIDEASSKYYLKLDGLSVLDYDTVFDIDIEKYNAATGKWELIQTSRYSVNSYVYAVRTSDDSAMANMAKTLYNYGVSAEAFALVD